MDTAVQGTRLVSSVGEMSSPQHLGPDLIAAFTAYLVARGLADKTVRDYRFRVLRFWCDWCFPHDMGLIDVEIPDVHAYYASLPATGSARSDAARALKSFYRAMVDLGYRLEDPTRILRPPRHRMTDAPVLTSPEIRALLKACFHREPRRGWAVILGLETGARIGSLVALEPRDVRGDSIVFRVAKNDRPYTLPLTRRGRIAALHLIAEGHQTLFGVGPERFRQWLRIAASDAGLGRTYPHLLRHTFSDRTAQAGDPDAWRRAMNHADLSQFARYNHADRERIRSIMEA